MDTNQLTQIAIDLGGAFSAERIKYSLEMTILGLFAVFSVLAIIWGILAIFKVLLYDIPNKNKHSNTNNADRVPEITPIAPAVENKPSVVSGNDATVAAIIAAISAYIADDPELSAQYPNGFRVVSFKRTRSKAFWNSKK